LRSPHAHHLQTAQFQPGADLSRQGVHVRRAELLEARRHHSRGMAGPDDMLISEYFIHYLQEKRQDSNWRKPFNFNHRIKINDSVIAVIYAIDSSETACPKDMRCIYNRLVTYNTNGKIISSDIVTTQSGDELTTLHFNHNKYTVTHYKRYWEKPYVKGDFDNYLVKTEEFGDVDFEITPAGDIEKIRKPYRD